MRLDLVSNLIIDQFFDVDCGQVTMDSLFIWLTNFLANHGVHIW